MKGAVGAQAFENLLLKKAIENEYKISDKELEEAIARTKRTTTVKTSNHFLKNKIGQKNFSKNKLNLKVTTMKN